MLLLVIVVLNCKIKKYALNITKLRAKYAKICAINFQYKHVKIVMKNTLKLHKKSYKMYNS